MSDSAWERRRLAYRLLQAAAGAISDPTLPDEAAWARVAALLAHIPEERRKGPA